jgi:hypothetical protein
MQVNGARPSTQRLALPAPGSEAALRAIKAIKAIHTLAWFSIEACMVYVLYAGFARRSDRSAGIAAAVVAGESLIFAGNGFRCPLTKGRRAPRCRAWLGHRHPAPVVCSQSSCYPCPADGPGRVPACEKPPGPALTLPDLAGGGG